MQRLHNIIWYQNSLLITQIYEIWKALSDYPLCEKVKAMKFSLGPAKIHEKNSEFTALFQKIAEAIAQHYVLLMNVM